jgi:hypothetical protein
MQYENKVGTIKGIHLLNIRGENSFEDVQKIPKGPLVDKCGMRWNANLKKSEEISRF